MLELYVTKVTRAVLRWERGSNPSDLTDVGHVWLNKGGANKLVPPLLT